MPDFNRTAPALVVLNLLWERPRHPYALRILIRERGIDSVVRMGSASIYDAVERLERAGLIEASATTREGRRPERTVYSITEAGKDERGIWMAELLSEPAREYPQFALALAFVIGVGRQATLNLLRRRVTHLESQVAADEKVIEAMRSMPRIIIVEGEYGQAMRRAEVAWVREIIDDIETGRLWTDAEIESLFAMHSDADQDEHTVPAEIARAIERSKGVMDDERTEHNHA